MGLELRIVNCRHLGGWPDGQAIRYELDRSLTPMSHVSFSKAPGDTQDDLCATLAQRYFKVATDCGLSLERVHMFSNFASAYFNDEAISQDSQESLADAINKLFIHYLPGVTPTPVELEPTAQGTAEAAPGE